MNKYNYELLYNSEDTMVRVRRFSPEYTAVESQLINIAMYMQKALDMLEEAERTHNQHSIIELNLMLEYALSDFKRYEEIRDSFNENEIEYY